MCRHLFCALIVSLCFGGMLQAQSFVMDSNFDADLQGWTITNASNPTAANRQWTRTPGNYASPSNGQIGSFNNTQFMLIDADTVGATGATIDTTATSPQFNGATVAGTLQLRFSHNFSAWSTETGTVEIYNGNTWVQVVQYAVAQSVGQGLWAPSTVTFDITAHKHPLNQVRFRYLDPAAWGWSWAFDNVQVLYFTGPEIDVNFQAQPIATGGTAYAGIQAPNVQMGNLVFVVQNPGDQVLTHTVQVLNQVNCAAGAVLGAQTNAAAQSNCVVTVTPGANFGVFSFQLSIANNDTTGNENPYIINVQGLCRGTNLQAYTGDWDGVDGVVAGSNFAVPTNAWIYERFVVPAAQTWTVNQLFANFLSDDVTGVTTADFEIRTGVAIGNGGTVVHSGIAVPATVVRFGGDIGGGFFPVAVAATPAAPIQLAAGTYFIGVRPVKPGFTGSCFMATTSGLSGTVAPDVFAIWDDVVNQFQTGLRYQQAGSGAAFYDFSMGVLATPAASLPAISVVATDPAAAEATPAVQTGTYTLTVNPAPLAPVTMVFGMSGAASNVPGTDYNLSTPTVGAQVNFTGPGGTITIPIGATSVDIILTPVDDILVESAEIATFTVAPGTGYTVGAPATADVTIADNDGSTTPVVTVTASGTASETGPTPGTFTFTASPVPAATITVNFVMGGTATLGADYTVASSTTVQITTSGTATLTVNVIDDFIVDPGETVNLQLSAGTGYTVGNPGSAQMVIADNDLPISVTVQSSGSPAEAGSAQGTFTLTATPAPQVPINVNFSLSGSATVGADYAATATTTVQIGLGGTATVTITPVDDTIVEGAETVELTLLAGLDYTVGVPANAVLVITDNDFPPAPLLITTTSPLPNATRNVAYNTPIVATGGSGTFAWSVQVGTSLPAGLSLTDATISTCRISGSPAVAGVFNFTLEVTDGTSTTPRNFTLTIVNPPPIGGGSGGGGGGTCAASAAGVSLSPLALLAVLWRRRRKA